MENIVLNNPGKELGMKKIYIGAIVLLTTIGFVGLAGLSADTTRSTDRLTNKQVKELIANAKTPADHMKLAKHFTAVAVQYEAEGVEHAAEARAYQKNPTFMETKHPSGPGTVGHCDRFAELSGEAAKEARELASAHEHMATDK